MTQGELFKQPAPASDSTADLVAFASTCFDCNTELGTGTCNRCQQVNAIADWGEWGEEE